KDVPAKLGLLVPKVNVSGWPGTPSVGPLTVGCGRTGSIKRTAVAGVAREAPPCGLLRVRFTVSWPSGCGPLSTGTWKVAVVSPGPNVSVPDTAVKLTPSTAVPAAAV